jgi:hypothetical protein
VDEAAQADRHAPATAGAETWSRRGLETWLTLSSVPAIGWLSALERRLSRDEAIERLVLKSYRRGEAIYLVTLRPPADLAALTAALRRDLACEDATPESSGSGLRVRLRGRDDGTDG